MGETHQSTGDGYEAWMEAALRQLDQLAQRRGGPLLAHSAGELAPHERAALVLDRVVAALATEARIEATIDAATCEAWLAAGCARDDTVRG